jgi:hypothetical protein
MNWTDGPATWKQLRYLSHHGFKPDHALTKMEASELIRKFGGDPESFVTTATESVPTKNVLQVTAHQLRSAVETAKQALAVPGASASDKLHHELALAIGRRQEFWIDTCREARKTFMAVLQANELYAKHGCRFVAPLPKHVQHILDALDSAAPFWDKEHPELFYQTLQLNFPELVRR